MKKIKFNLLCGVFEIVKSIANICVKTMARINDRLEEMNKRSL